MLLEREARSLLYGTFFGGDGGDGDHVDGGTCRFDKKGIIYHAACVCRENRFFTTAGAWARSNLSTTPNTPNTPGSGCNNAAFKIDIEILRAGFLPVNAATGVEQRRGCAPLNLRFLNRSSNAETISWDINNGLFTSQATEPTYNFTQAGRYVVRQRVTNRITCATLTVFDTIIVSAVLNPTINRDTTKGFWWKYLSMESYYRA
jgi:PKD repeat protein